MFVIKNGFQKNSKACHKNWLKFVSTIGIFEENKTHTFFSDPPGKVETYELKRVEVKLVGNVLGMGGAGLQVIYILYLGDEQQPS